MNLLFQGEYPYDALFEKDDFYKSFRIKHNLLGSTKSYCPVIHYTLDLLTRTSGVGSNKVMGRQIITQAENSLKNIRKVYGFTREKYNVDLMQPIYSGDTEDSVIAHMKKQIWDTSHTGVPMTDTYVFKGFFAFILWGPFFEPGKRLMLFDPYSVEKDPRFKKLSRANKSRCELDLTNSERSSDKFMNRCLTNQQVIQKETNRIRIMN